MSLFSVGVDVVLIMFMVIQLDIVCVFIWGLGKEWFSKVSESIEMNVVFKFWIICVIVKIVRLIGSIQIIEFMMKSVILNIKLCL